MRLGQHFLINKKKIKKIIDALELKPNETIIEIGPGHGEITREIRNEKLEIRIIAIEKDKHLVHLLQQKFSGDKNIKIIHGDVLKILKSYTLNLKPYKIVGNIPYYITGHLLRIIGELKNKPSLIVLTLQKEVAQRICVKPPKMNLLAASVQFWAEPEIIEYISKKDFKPSPKVDSAIIKFNIRRFDLPKLSSILRRSNLQEIENNYYKFIRILFKQPRKTILNNLLNIKRSDLPKIDINIRRSALQKLLQKSGIKPSDRPQNLTFKEIKRFSKVFNLAS